VHSLFDGGRHPFGKEGIPLKTTLRPQVPLGSKGKVGPVRKGIRGEEKDRRGDGVDAHGHGHEDGGESVAWDPHEKDPWMSEAEDSIARANGVARNGRKDGGRRR